MTIHHTFPYEKESRGFKDIPKQKENKGKKMVRVCKCIYNKEAYNVLLLLVALLNRTIAENNRKKMIK